jgi:hypothetical protein
MTETEWLASTNPAPMLESLRGKVSARKLGLFVAACCRQLLSDLPIETKRLSLAVVEQIAEGNIMRMRNRIFQVPAGQAVIDCGASEPHTRTLVSLSSNEGPIRFDPAKPYPLLSSVLERLVCYGPNTWQSQRLVETFAQAGLSPTLQAHYLRDVVRGLFRPLLVRAAWKTHDGGVCVRIGQAIYQDATFGDLPILADALEDSGCDNAEILRHCREPGEHVRGCWVVDLLLGKA